MDSEDLVVVHLPWLQRTLLTESAVVKTCFLRCVTCGQSVGWGAPIWSLHASFIGLSEAIFQNWLHLRTHWGATMLVWLVRGVAPCGSVCGSWGLRSLTGRRGCLYRPHLHPTSPPPQLSGCDLKAFYHFHNDVSNRPLPQSQKRYCQSLHLLFV